MAKDKDNKLAFSAIENKAVAEVPDWLKSEAGKGGLKTGTEMVFGFAKLLQALSPEVSAEGSNLKAGEMINSLSLAHYNKEFTFIPLLDAKQAIRWIPREQGGGMDCVSSDLVAGSKYGDCAKCEFNYDAWKRPDVTAEQRKGLCTMYLNFPSLINGEDMPTVIGFEKTKYKIGQKLKALYVNRCSEMGQSYPIYAMKFRITSVADKSSSGNFFNFDVSYAGLCTQEEFVKAKKWAEIVEKISFKTAEEKAPF